MSDEPNLRTKTDVLDLVISFMMDHEKQMDQMLERIEKVAEKLSSKDIRTSHLSFLNKSSRYQHDRFTITIDNPDTYGPIKSIKIDWENPEHEVNSDNRKVLSFLEEIEQYYQDTD